MRRWIGITVVGVLSLCLADERARAADVPGQRDYRENCARCHGADGKGAVPSMRATRGYVAVDLTQLSRAHDGHFPRQEVYNTIDGRKRFPGHLVGDMPAWGLKFHATGEQTPAQEKAISAKLDALVDYIESLQQR